MKIFALFFGVVFGYRESYQIIPLIDGSYILELNFQITHDEETLIPSLVRNFPADFKGTLVRGVWRPVWGPPVSRPGPPGSSMVLFQNTSLWTRLGWLLSGALGGAFESLLPEQKSYWWITPVVIDGNVFSSNPNEPCCTEQLDRFVKLLPCRGRSGLGKWLLDNADVFANSQLAGLTVERGLNFSGRVSLHMLELPMLDLPAANCMDTKPVQEVGVMQVDPPHIVRSLRPTSHPERLAGVYRVEITGETGHFYDQLPFFLVPLWHTMKVNDDKCENLCGLTIRTVSKTTYFDMPIRDKTLIEFTFEKRFVPVDKFSFGFEKGFDLGSAVFVHSRGAYITDGSLTIIPLADATATFNMIAITCTAIALFYGSIFRSFISKRSLLVRDDPDALDEKESPLIRLVKWTLMRLVKLVWR